jgi:DNA-binding transcriptional LysR family regulator
MPADLQDHPDVRWDDIRVYLAAHRYKSLGAAARRLGVDTSTVSRRIAALEDALGVKLFERTRDGLLHTRAAERVLAAAEAMEAAHGRLTRDASDVETAAEGIVRLSVAPGTADLFVAPMLVRLRRRHPGVSIELDASVQPRDLTRHEADLALRSVPPRGADLVTTKLGSGRWIPAGSPELVEEHGKLAAWSDVPWIGWDRDLASFAPARWLAQHVAKAEVVLRTSQFSAQIAAARTSLGAVLLPAPYIRVLGLAPLPYAKALAPSLDGAPSDDLWLVCHRVLRDLPRVAAVWTFLAEEMRALMGTARGKRQIQ